MAQSVAWDWLSWLSWLSLLGSVPSTGAGVHFHLLYCAVGLGLVGMLLEAIGEKVAEAEQAALIYNYVTTYTGAKGSSFEEEYIWPQPGSA